jgi:hypothetical protein
MFTQSNTSVTPTVDRSFAAAHTSQHPVFRSLDLLNIRRMIVVLRRRIGS